MHALLAGSSYMMIRMVRSSREIIGVAVEDLGCICACDGDVLLQVFVTSAVMRSFDLSTVLFASIFRYVQ